MDENKLLKELRKVVYLSRLKLTDEEEGRLTGNVSDIIDYIALLKEVDTEGIEETSNSIGVTNVFRQDEKKLSLSIDKVLENVPLTKDNFMVVPKIIN